MHNTIYLTMTTILPQKFTGNIRHQVTDHLLTTPTTSTTPTKLITSTSKQKICIPLTTNAILPGVLVTNPLPNHKYNTCNCPPITPPPQSSSPPNKSPNPKQHPLPKKSPETKQLPKVKQFTMPKKDPKEMPRAKQTQTPPPQSPSPPKSTNESPNPKKPSLPKKSPTPKKDLNEMWTFVNLFDQTENIVKLK